MYYLSAIATALATTSQVIAQAGKIIEVQVGANGLTFTPNEVTAKVGTAIEFSFFPKVRSTSCFQSDNTFPSSRSESTNQPSHRTTA
jgi:plastocyanin